MQDFMFKFVNGDVTAASKSRETTPEEFAKAAFIIAFILAYNYQGASDETVSALIKETKKMVKDDLKKYPKDPPFIRRMKEGKDGIQN